MSNLHFLRKEKWIKHYLVSCQLIMQHFLIHFIAIYQGIANVHTMYPVLS